MKNRQEFMKKMSIAEDSFTAISNFYGKMKSNPHQKTKLINSIKKEINKITRIKEVFKNPSCNYPTEDKEKLMLLRDRLDEEDRKLRGFLKKGYLSGEEESDGQLIDVEEEDFMLYYYSRFSECKKELEAEIVRLTNANKRKKHKNNNQVKEIQAKVQCFEEHQYLLQQLFNNRDMIDSDKLENIKEDMDHFLMEPGDEKTRQELTAEYQQILEDINEDLEEERIEKFKEEIYKQNVEIKDEKLAVFENINTEENMQELIDVDPKLKHKESITSNKQKYNKDLEPQKKYSIGSNNSNEENKKSDGENEETENIQEVYEIKETMHMDKVNENKPQTQKSQTPGLEEIEKLSEVKEMSLEESMLKPTPIITPSVRSTKDFEKRKKSLKKDTLAKHINTSLQVDPQNFPALGTGNSAKLASQSVEPKSTSATVAPTTTSPPKVASPPKAVSPPTTISQPTAISPPTAIAPPTTISPPPKSVSPPPRQPAPKIRTPFNSKTSVLSLLDRSYERMRYEYESTPQIPNVPNLNIKQLISKFSDSTLFFIFYYQQGTFKQLLAAEELIKRKWQYQSKFQTWFRENDKGDGTKGDKLYFEFGHEWTTKIVKIQARQ